MALNPELPARVTLLPLCISDHASVSTLYSYGAAGDSMSSLVAEAGTARHTWRVTCAPLLPLLEALAVAPADVALIKIDTEGGEATVLPYLVPWLARNPHVVVMLSVHGYKLDGEAHAPAVAALVAAIGAFPTARMAENLDAAPVPPSRDSLCGLCTVLLTFGTLPEPLALPPGVRGW